MKSIHHTLDRQDLENIHEDIEALRKIPYSSDVKVEITANDVILKKDTGENMSLSSLLPDNFILHWKKKGQFICTRHPRLLWRWPAQVEYPIEDSDKAKFLLVLLHEIWHTWDEQLNEAEKVNYEELRTLSGWSTKIFPRIIKQLVAILGNEKSVVHYSKEDTDLTKKNERFAWNFALRKYRELKKTWWDVSWWLSDEQISDLVRNSLLTYEGRNINRFPWDEQTYVGMTNRKRWTKDKHSIH